MSSAGPVFAGARPPTFDRLALLELLGGFVLMTAVFGILTARVIDIPSGHGYTARGLAVGFAVGAGIALALAVGAIWGWRRNGGRPAQRRALQVWRSGVLPESSTERALVLRNLERQERTATRSGLPPAVAAVMWVLIAGLQIAVARDLLTSVAWVLFAAVFVGQAVVTRRRQRRISQLDALITRLRFENL